MRRAIISVLFLYLSLICGIRKVYALADPDTASINQRLQVAFKVLNPDSAILLFDKVIEESKKVNYGNGVFLAMITKGIKYFEKEDYLKYRQVTREALRWAAWSEKKDAAAWCYGNIGESYFSEGEYIRASEYYYIALEEAKKANGGTPNKSIANIYNSLGNVYIRLNQPEKALAYYRQAEGIASRAGLDYQLACSYYSMGEYFTSVGKTDTAKNYFLRVLEIGNGIDKPDLLAIANNDLGKNYIVAGDYSRATAYLQKAISIARNRFPYIVADASYSLGSVWYHTHDYKQAENILTSALADVTAHNYKDSYIKYYRTLIAVYRATGQYEKALDCTDIVTALKDSLMNAGKAAAINDMEIKYQTAEKDVQIAQNKLLIAEQHNKITEKNIWIGSVAAGLLLLGVIATAVYRHTRHKQRLQTEQISSLQKENTIGILKGVVQGEENERGRIARELHDGIGGMLSAAMMRFMSIRHANASITEIEAYKDAMHVLEEMGDEIRKTAHNLMPEPLLKQSLPDALQVHCNNVRSGGSLQVDFQHYGNFDDLGQDFKLNVYRIVQELLKNVSIHAAATHALVQLVMHEETLTITVEDNGKGFDVDERSNGLGLHNLRTRVLSLNGQYALESERQKGTSVFIEIDMRHQPFLPSL